MLLIKWIFFGLNISMECQQGIDEGLLVKSFPTELSVWSQIESSRKTRAIQKSHGGGSAMDCTGPTTPFNSLVLVRFRGNPDDVSRSDVGFLEVAFRETYNDLISTICDDEDRLVVQASAIPQQEFEVIRNGGLSYSIKFAVDLTYRGCDNSTASAFSPPKGFDPYRRRLHNASQTKTSGLKTSEYLETHTILTIEALEKEKYEKNQSGKAGKVGTEGGKGGKKGNQKGEGGMKNGKGGKEAGKRKGGSSKQGAGNNGITGKGGGGKKGGDERRYYGLQL
ncbi:hypothetical protein MHU86_18388 [Fragilaria crotonensis]|nr:hypothetical protein MHU86_18388 [Fragilaria crotonensis]